ncbi:MAG: hypothetical protein NTZ20_05530 [Candidatus Levybacteria bacterium]|nr:hypothetical protein [Candidatus Levybacteria bacterium]
MIRFKNFLLMIEELNASQKEEVSKWPRDPKAIAATDHYFGKGNDEVTRPLEGTQDKSEVHKKVEQHLERQIPIENYKANKISGEGTAKISQFIKNKDILQDFNRDETRKGGLSTLVTRSAHGVAGQTSCGQSWADASCKNFETGKFNKVLKPEVKHGTVVTYLKDAEGKEIARATLQPHYNNMDHVAYALNSYYGDHHAAFKEHIDQLAKDLSGPHKGGSLIYKIHPEVYNDMGDDYTKILHPQITSTQLKNLQNNRPNDLSIHRAIYNHPNTTKEIIHNGIKSVIGLKSVNVNKALIALDSKRLKTEHIDTALAHSSPEVRAAAMESEKVSRTQLHTALKDNSTDVRLSALGNPKIKREHLDAVFADKTNEPEVRESAARHKSATEDNINQGLDDPDYSVKLSAIRNKNATDKNITKALDIKSDGKDDHDDYVNTIHKQAINHKNSTHDHHMIGLTSLYPEVRESAQRMINLRKLEEFQRNLR